MESLRIFMETRVDEVDILGDDRKGENLSRCDSECDHRQSVCAGAEGNY